MLPEQLLPAEAAQQREQLGVGAGDDGSALVEQRQQVAQAAATAGTKRTGRPLSVRSPAASASAFRWPRVAPPAACNRSCHGLSGSKTGCLREASTGSFPRREAAPAPRRRTRGAPAPSILRAPG